MVLPIYPYFGAGRWDKCDLWDKRDELARTETVAYPTSLTSSHLSHKSAQPSTLNPQPSTHFPCIWGWNMVFYALFHLKRLDSLDW